MVSPWRFARIAVRALKCVLTGETIQRADIEIAGGLIAVSWRLKRERRSGNEYVVLVANGYHYVFELDEFDRFIEAANTVRESHTSAAVASSDAAPKLGRITDMVLTGEVLQRVDTTIYEGCLEISLRLKRDKKTLEEFVVLAAIASGWYMYQPFRLDEFHRFVAAAKKLRALSQSADPMRNNRSLMPQTERTMESVDRSEFR